MLSVSNICAYSEAVFEGVKMTEREPISVENINAQYDNGKLVTINKTQVISWETARTYLAESRYFWLATVREDGQPQIRPVLAVWVEGTLYSTTNPATRKGRNLIRSSRFSIATSTDDLDLIVEGKAIRVTDEAEVKRVAEAYAAKYEWIVEIRDGAFDAPYGAPTASAPPYYVYRLQPQVVFGLGTNETFAPRSTRWRF
jgi:nitroimidazol reductase NimA-like FMN-containing flavoprotein (pyridoxamine 5'-phosphate oxidase superfamily)